MNRWHFGLNDAGLFSWLLTLVYFGTALACLRAAKRRAAGALATPGGRVWQMLALLLLLIGINKPLDLQEIMFDVGRRMAKELGWWPWRRWVLGLFLSALLGLLAGVAVWSKSRCRGQGKPLRVAVGSGVALGTVILLRFLPSHHRSGEGLLDTSLFTGQPERWQLHVVELFELGLTIAIWISARQARLSSGHSMDDHIGTSPQPTTGNDIPE